MAKEFKVLVTGGAGFIGSHIADEALAQGYQVVIVDDMSNGRVANLSCDLGPQKYLGLSILDAAFSQVVQAEMPQVIFHEAAQPSLRRSIEEPAFDAEVNILGTIRVLQAARSVGAHLMFASTSAVYAPDAPTPFYEPDSGRPNLPYGIAKFASELYIKNSGIPFTILRYGNVYGPRQCPVGENQLIPHCIRYLKGQEPEFAINGDGAQMRDFVFVKDIARANLMVRQTGIYNCGTGVGTSVNAVCRMLAEIAGKPETEFKHRAAKLGEARHSILATQLIQQTGWQARTKLYDGLRETWKSYAATD
jgi:UDP-glucose 4-epimerase